MPQKLLFINACIRRNESRTLAISAEIIERLSGRYDIEEIELEAIPIKSINNEIFNQRCSGIYDDDIVAYAKKVASADRIIIAAPFWDMSFPSILKVFFENVSINGITFKDTSDGSTMGICAASKILLITTRGMEIADESPLDQASSYIRAISWLWGIPEYHVLSAIGMDVCDDETRTARLNTAKEKGLKICEDF